MSMVAFFLLWRGIALWRIETLFWCVLLLLALFPTLAFSVGFYFSSLGVLYIFLFFKYFKIPQGFWKRCVYGIALNASTFFLMGIVVYYFFPPFSPLSLFSLILTPLFSLYYPFIFVAHLLGIGGILDSILLGWLSLPIHTIALEAPLVLFILCIPIDKILSYPIGCQFTNQYFFRRISIYKNIIQYFSRNSTHITID